MVNMSWKLDLCSVFLQGPSCMIRLLRPLMPTSGGNYTIEHKPHYTYLKPRVTMLRMPQPYTDTSSRIRLIMPTSGVDYTTKYKPCNTSLTLRLSLSRICIHPSSNDQADDVNLRCWFAMLHNPHSTYLTPMVNMSRMPRPCTHPSSMIRPMMQKE